ncbi:MAG: hypothetical protein Q9204_005229 [Flavoplaca sp. TL-2023a]
MSQREEAWKARSRAMGRPIHGDPDPDGDGYAAYTAACHKNDASRDAYDERQRAHAAEVRALDAEQQRYYQLATSGYFPTAHRELKPLARELADDATG